MMDFANSRKSVSILVLLSAAIARPVTAATRVTLTLTERRGIARTDEPVTCGVPIPKGQLPDVKHVRLLQGGREVPAQFRAVGLWRPGSSVRWLLVDCRATLNGGARQPFVLEYGPDVTPSARPAAALQVEQTPTAYVVSTGAARFRLNRERFTLFDEVRLADGTVLVAPPARGDAPRGAVLEGLKQTVTRAVPAAANRGRAHLITVRRKDKAPQEDYTLRFVTDRTFELAGKRSGPLGQGEYLKNFTSRDGAIAIPADAWLRYAYPKSGDVYTFRSLPDDTMVAGEAVTHSTVLERGPLRTVIRMKGTLGPAAAPAMEFTAWYTFTAGSARVTLAFTLENNNHGGRTPTGNARNADIGGINCVFFESMSLRLPLVVGANASTAIGHRIGGEVVVSAGFGADIYQDSSGRKHWDRYRDARFHPRPNSYVSFAGYKVLVGGKTKAAGQRAAGWLDMTGPRGGLTVAVRDFWQQFPKSLSTVTRGEAVAIGLFPARWAGPFAFRSGEHKTHEVLFDFHAPGGTWAERRAVGEAFSHPLRLEPAPEWTAATRALGDLHPFDITNRRAYEVRNLSTIGVFPEGVKPGMSLVRRIEEQLFYGWMDYGDVPMDFEGNTGQWGLKYDMDYHMARQYARTLRPEWWRLFDAAARHVADIDVHHQPHYPGLHFVKGGTWAHSLHNEPGHKNPHRNRNHFTKDLAFGALGTATYHCMTGNWKAHDTCLELAENALARYMSPRAEPDPATCDRMGWRGDACTLNRLLAGYMLSGDQKLLTRARWQVKSCAFTGRPAKHRPTSLWSSVFYMMALARYVEMFGDDRAAKAYLLAHLATLRKAARPDTGILYTVTPKPDGTVTGRGTCSHYNIMAADALAIGYRLTGDKAYLATAKRCFEYGVRNACWRNGPPTYVQVHSANGAMHGNVYMTVAAKANGSSKGR